MESLLRRFHEHRGASIQRLDHFNLHVPDVEEAFAALDAEVAHAREVADQMALDDTGTLQGEMVSLRWVLVHLIEEYARHNGHADLLRQCLDGAVGE